MQLLFYIMSSDTLHSLIQVKINMADLAGELYCNTFPRFTAFLNIFNLYKPHSSLQFNEL